MKAKILVYALPALILASIHLAEAQQPAGKIPRIGIVTGSAKESTSITKIFRQALQDLGGWRICILDLSPKRR